VFGYLWYHAHSHSLTWHVLVSVCVVAVPRPPTQSFAAALADKKLPIILTHTFIDKWAARKSWTPELLSQRLSKLRG